MSLNGLNEEKVNQAYENAIADAAGWFLLKYASRDEVELLDGGNGGFVETKDAIASYEESSPLFGLVVYRRKKVLLKYVPDGTSRLLQARLIVHLQSVIERFPHDALLSLVTASGLSETALSSSVSTLKSSGSFRANKPKNQRPLTEIIEDVGENTNGKRAQPASPTKEALENGANEGIECEVPSQEEESILHNSAVDAGSTERSHSGQKSISSVKRSSFEDRPSSETPSFDRGPSFQSTRTLSKEQPTPFTFKSKLKLGPRPSMENGHQPRKSGSFARPVSTLPAGIRMPLPKRPAEDERPKTQHLASRPFFPDNGRMPMAFSTASIINAPTGRPPSRSGSIMTVPTYAHYPDLKSPTSPTITPEKQRLMKALQQRKKHQSARKAAEEALATQSAIGTEEEGKGADHNIEDVGAATIPDFSQANADYDLPASVDSIVESIPANESLSEYGSPADDKMMNGHSDVPPSSDTKDPHLIGRDIAVANEDHTTSTNTGNLERFANTEIEEVGADPTALSQDALLDSHVPFSPAQPAIADEESLHAETEKSQGDGSPMTPPDQTTFLLFQSDEEVTPDEVEDRQTGEAINGNVECVLRIEEDAPVAQEPVALVNHTEDAACLLIEPKAQSIIKDQVDTWSTEDSSVDATPSHMSFLMDENEAEETQGQILDVGVQSAGAQSVVATAETGTLTSEHRAYFSSREEEGAQGIQVESTTMSEKANARANARDPDKHVEDSESSKTKLRISLSLLPSEHSPGAERLALEQQPELSLPKHGEGLPPSHENGHPVSQTLEEVDPHVTRSITPDTGIQSLTQHTPKAASPGPTTALDESRPSSSDTDDTALATTPRRKALPKTPLQQDNSDANSLSGDSFLEEIQGATVEEAKPIFVSRSPATPIFPGSSKPSTSGKSNDYFRPTSSASNSAQVNQFSTSDSYLSKPTNNSTAQLLRNGTLPFRSISTSTQSTTLPIEVSSSVSQRLSSINTPRPASTSPTLQRAPTTDSLPTKKSSVSSLISQRIKALEKFSNAAQPPNVTTANIAPSFVSKRKASLSTPIASSGVETVITSSARPESRPYPTPSPSPHGNFMTRTFGVRRPPSGDSKMAPERAPEPVREPVAAMPPKPIEIPEPSPKKLKPVPSPISVVPTSSSAPTSPRLTRPKHQKQSSSYFSRSSKRSKSKTNSVSSISSSVMDSLRDSVPSPTRNSFSSRRSTSSRNGSIDAGQPSSPVRPDTGGSRSHSEGDKKESKSARLLRRMSTSIGLSPRRNIAHVLGPPLNNQPIEESQEPEPSKQWTAISIGDLNVQFPDTLFWKRRHIEIDSHGYLVLSPSKLERSSRAGAKQYHITEFRWPYVPDQDREELPHSVILDFHDSSTLQYACENWQGQQEVLKVLQSAQSFFSATERD